jgi:hypothetical protein
MYRIPLMCFFLGRPPRGYSNLTIDYVTIYCNLCSLLDKLLTTGLLFCEDNDLSRFVRRKHSWTHTSSNKIHRIQLL